MDVFAFLDGGRHTEEPEACVIHRSARNPDTGRRDVLVLVELVGHPIETDQRNVIDRLWSRCDEVDVIIDVVAEDIELAAKLSPVLNRSFFLMLRPISLFLPTSGRRLVFGRKQKLE